MSRRQLSLGHRGTEYSINVERATTNKKNPWKGKIDVRLSHGQRDFEDWNRLFLRVIPLVRNITVFAKDVGCLGSPVILPNRFPVGCPPDRRRGRYATTARTYELMSRIEGSTMWPAVTNRRGVPHKALWRRSFRGQDTRKDYSTENGNKSFIRNSCSRVI